MKEVGLAPPSEVLDGGGNSAPLEEPQSEVGRMALLWESQFEGGAMPLVWSTSEEEAGPHTPSRRTHEKNRWSQ